MVRRFFVLLLALVTLSGCSVTASQQGQDLSGRQIRVTATVGMVGDLVKNIGGDRVVVSSLMGPGVDPHLYKPTAGDVRKLEDADIVFYNGLELEGRMTDVFVKLARTGKPTVAVSESVDHALLREPPEFDGKFDPHIWFDVALWKQTIPSVVKALSEIDPGSRALYQKNGEAYTQQLDTLHGEIKTLAATVPERSRVLITAHDAFGYFGEAYGFEVRGLQGISTAAEAGAGDVRDLATYICGRGVKAIFVESSVSPATIQAVQRAAQANNCDVTVGGQLYSDALGDAGTPAGTYLGMVRSNVQTIVGALK